MYSMSALHPESSPVNQSSTLSSFHTDCSEKATMPVWVFLFGLRNQPGFSMSPASYTHLNPFVPTRSNKSSVRDISSILFFVFSLISTPHLLFAFCYADSRINNTCLFYTSVHCFHSVHVQLLLLFFPLSECHTPEALFHFLHEHYHS